MTDDIFDRPDEDQPLDPRLLDLARGYHPPPATPRDAMWARIAAERGAPVVPIDAARSRRGRPRPWAIVAAALAAGVAFGAIGMNVLQPDAEPTFRVATPGTQPRAESTVVVDTGTRVAELGPYTPPPPPRPGQPNSPLRGPEPERVQVAGGTPPTGNIRPDRRNALTDYARQEAAARDRAAAGQTLYRAAAVQTLSQAELLLVAWRTDAPRDTASSRQLGRWARDVLGSTRLLLDSPAARDPQLRALLDDLELVLAQIVQLSGATLTDEERALLEGSVRTRDLLPRIRSVVPAGATAI